MLSLIALVCSYRLFNYISQNLSEEQSQLVQWDSAIDMDDSSMSDGGMQDCSDRIDTDHNNLIVNYLPETTTQNDLQRMFEGFGQIESCKLIRHKQLGHSLGYGFVKFMKHEDAQAALEALNGLMMQNKKLKVSFARPANDPIRTANLYISGLKNTITEAELVGLFSPYGKVLTVKVMKNDNDPNKTTAIGFVRFEQHTNAQVAMDELNGTTPSMNPSPIHVSFAKQSRENAVAAAPPVPIPYSPYPPSRFANFGKTPTMLGKNMRFDPLARGPLSRGTVDSVYPVPDGYHNSHGLSQMGHVLFVFNLAPQVEELHLWRLFGPFGAVRSVKVIVDKTTNRCKGFAFITMHNYGDAENAILSLHNTSLEGRVIQVSFKKAKNV